MRFRFERLTEGGGTTGESGEPIHDKFNKFGVNINNMRYLGSGMMGHTFDIGNGRVAKFTSDYLEAKTAAHLRDVGPLKHTWQIHHAIEMSPQEVKELQPAFPNRRIPDFKLFGDKHGFPHRMNLKDDSQNAIHWGSRVDPCPCASHECPLSDIPNRFHHWVVIGEKLNPLSQPEHMLHDQADADVDAVIQPTFTRPTTFDIAAKTPEDFSAAIEKYTGYKPNEHHQFLYNAASELQHHGVGFSDTHSGNVMKDANGNHKLIDIGISEGPEAAKLDRFSRPSDPSTMRTIHKRMGGWRLPRYMNVPIDLPVGKQGMTSKFLHKIGVHDIYR